MNLKYGTVYLRAIEEEDLEFCREMMNHPGIEVSTVGKAFPVSKREQQNWYQNSTDRNNLRLMICIPEGGAIGMISLTGIDWINRSAEIGIKFLNSGKRSTQNTADACECILKYSFDELNLHSLYAQVLEDNLLSRKLLLGYGFTQEGVLRERVYKRGAYRNLLVYSLLKSEYRNSRNSENREGPTNDSP